MIENNPHFSQTQLIRRIDKTSECSESFLESKQQKQIRTQLEAPKQQGIPFNWSRRV